MKRALTVSIVLAGSLAALAAHADDAPATPPATGVAQPSTPATGTDGQPKKDSPAAAAAPKEKEPSIIDSFAGSSYFQQFATGTTTFIPAQQNYRGANFDTWASFSPRYAI